MKQARDGAGQYARHLGIVGHEHAVSPFHQKIDLKGDPMPPEVIASVDCVVHDPNMGIDRQIIAGQPVPPDLVDAYKARDSEAEKSQGECARDDAAAGTDTSADDAAAGTDTSADDAAAGTDTSADDAAADATKRTAAVKPGDDTPDKQSSTGK